MEELASKEGFELVVYESGFAPTGVCGAVQSMIAREVDAILLDLEAPVACTRAVLDAQQAGVPIAYYGARPPKPVTCPVIGYNNYEGARKLGASMARLFRQRFGDVQPRILVTATRSVPEDRALEQGFVDGFKAEAPEATVASATEDFGTIQDTTNAVAASLLKHSDVNVMFGTSDVRARGALNALTQSSGMKVGKVLLSRVGGSEDAMRQMLGGDTPWVGELAFPLEDAALQSYQVLLSMIEGRLALTSETEYQIMPQVFVNPDAEKIRRYLRMHRGIEQLQ
jgi:ABC-type sugar transport system substrate-binding protein